MSGRVRKGGRDVRCGQRSGAGFVRATRRARGGLSSLRASRSNETNGDRYRRRKTVQWRGAMPSPLQITGMLRVARPMKDQSASGCSCRSWRANISTRSSSYSSISIERHGLWGRLLRAGWRCRRMWPSSIAFGSSVPRSVFTSVSCDRGMASAFPWRATRRKLSDFRMFLLVGGGHGHRIEVKASGAVSGAACLAAPSPASTGIAAYPSWSGNPAA